MIQQLVKLQRLPPLPEVEVDRQGVPQHLAVDPHPQVPQVPRPGPLGPKPLHQLSDDRLDPPPFPGQPPAPPLWVLRAPLGGSQQLQAPLPQLLLKIGSPVVAIPQGPALSSGQHHLGDHPQPAHPQVPAEPVEGLLEQLVVAEGRLPHEAATALGPGELADIQGEAVYDRDARIVGNPLEQIAPQPFLDPLQPSGLPGELAVVDPGRSGEEVEPVPPEVGEDPLISVVAQKLPHDLHREDLAVAQGRARPATAPRSAVPKQDLEGVVDPDEDGYNELHQRQGSPPWSLGFPDQGSGNHALSSTPKLAHGVS